MTTLAPAVAPRRPVSWHRLAWVVWRRYRSTFLAVTGVLGILSVYLLVTGHRMRSAYAAAEACRPARSASCEFQWANFHDAYGGGGLMVAVLVLLPGIVGAFAGAPLLARELETGTFRYAWTQGVGRMRWAVAILLPGAVGVAVLMAAFGALTGWHDQPLFDAGTIPRLESSAFPVTGLAVAGWTLVGFAIGVVAGVLWHRVVPAVVAAFGLWFGLAYAASVVRRHYEAPLTTTKLQLGPGDMTIAQWWDKSGVRVPDAQINQVLQAIGAQVNGGGGKVTVHPGVNTVDPVHYLLQHGYTQVTSYQPDSRYWTFQWIEFGWLLVLSLALLGSALWLLRRRSA